jgi:hypothetical protein
MHFAECVSQMSTEMIVSPFLSVNQMARARLKTSLKLVNILGVWNAALMKQFAALPV